jgi:hypothetical protein
MENTENIRNWIWKNDTYDLYIHYYLSGYNPISDSFTLYQHNGEKYEIIRNIRKNNKKNKKNKGIYFDTFFFSDFDGIQYQKLKITFEYNNKYLTLVFNQPQLIHKPKDIKYKILKPKTEDFLKSFKPKVKEEEEKEKEQEKPMEFIYIPRNTVTPKNDSTTGLINRIKNTTNKIVALDRKKQGGKKEKKRSRKWSVKYKRSIDCNHPRGFSQKQHCKSL